MSVIFEELPSSLNFVAEGEAIQTPKDVIWKVNSGSFRNAGSRVDMEYTIIENNQ